VAKRAEWCPLLPDRSAGLYVLWYAHRLPRGTHIRPDGSFEPGTDGWGVSLALWGLRTSNRRE
jgi:hypothetical protein